MTFSVTRRHSNQLNYEHHICGNGVNRTLSALRQQIVIGGVYDTPILPTNFQSAICDSLLCYYSLSRLSNCGAFPILWSRMESNHHPLIFSQVRTDHLRYCSNFVRREGLEPPWCKSTTSSLYTFDLQSNDATFSNHLSGWHDSNVRPPLQHAMVPKTIEVDQLLHTQIISQTTVLPTGIEPVTRRLKAACSKTN